MPDGWEKTIGLADMYGTVAKVSFSPADEEFDIALTTLVLNAGAASIRVSPTPEAIRQLAAALLDGVEQMEQAG